MNKLRDPYDLAEEIWACVVDNQLDGDDAIGYIADIITDDRELLTRELVNNKTEMLH